MSVFCHICEHMCDPGACIGQTKSSDFLELQLQIFVTHHVGLGN